MNPLPLEKAVIHHALGEQQNKNEEKHDKRELQDSTEIILRLRGGRLLQFGFHECRPSADPDKWHQPEDRADPFPAPR
jgi:hypothetical protein